MKERFHVDDAVVVNAGIVEDKFLRWIDAEIVLSLIGLPGVIMKVEVNVRVRFEDGLTLWISPECLDHYDVHFETNDDLCDLLGGD